MLAIDRTWGMTVPASDEIVLRYRRLLPDGTPSEMQGEVWAFVIDVRGDEPIVATGTRAADLDGSYFEMRHASDVGETLAGRTGLRWRVAEVLPGGSLDTRFSGPLTIARAPGLDIAAPTIGDGETMMLIEEEDE